MDKNNFYLQNLSSYSWTSVWHQLPPSWAKNQEWNPGKDSAAAETQQRKSEQSSLELPPETEYDWISRLFRE